MCLSWRRVNESQKHRVSSSFDDPSPYGVQHDTWNGVSEETVAAQSEVQADLDKEGLDQSEQTLNVESEELKEALDRMLVEFNVAISSKPEEYGLDLVEDGSLLVRGDNLSR